MCTLKYLYDFIHKHGLNILIYYNLEREKERERKSNQYVYVEFYVYSHNSRIIYLCHQFSASSSCGNVAKSAAPDCQYSRNHSWWPIGSDQPFRQFFFIHALSIVVGILSIFVIYQVILSYLSNYIISPSSISCKNKYICIVHIISLSRGIFTFLQLRYDIMQLLSGSNIPAPVS